MNWLCYDARNSSSTTKLWRSPKEMRTGISQKDYQLDGTFNFDGLASSGFRGKSAASGM